MLRKCLKYAADQAADTAFTIGVQAYLFYRDKAVAWTVRDDLLPDEPFGMEVHGRDAFVGKVVGDLHRLGAIDVTAIPPELAEAVHRSLDDMRDAEIADRLAKLVEREERTEVPYA